ncbi:hypothetical protein HOY80DRAFT_1045975 [Tuber brumale]|nr:hypothetical protein HOY80DRAFT_1045975 [Tuber brumale]
MQWDNDLSPISNPELLSGQLEPIIMVTQDECTFNANDGRHFIWTHKEHQPLRKKGRGQGLHVSDLLIPIGRLGDGAACEILKCGGNIWWDGGKLLEQIKTKAIPLFEAEFPWTKALFLFNNAKPHCKYADDALRVSKMNLADGGKHAKAMRSTYVVDESHPNGGYYQSMVQEDGTPKGLKSVLTERGLWPSTGGPFLTQCSIKTPAGNTTPNPQCLKGGSCCARALGAAQPDFKAQKGELQEAIEAAGHRGLFYPAFHCEINFIDSPVTKAHYMNYEFTSNSTLNSDFDYIFEAPHCPIYIHSFKEIFEIELFEIEEEYTQEPSRFTVTFRIPTRDQFNRIYRTWHSSDFEWNSTASENFFD